MPHDSEKTLLFSGFSPNIPQPRHTGRRTLIAATVLLFWLLARMAHAAPVARVGSVDVLGHEGPKILLGAGVFNFSPHRAARHNHRSAAFDAQFQVGYKLLGVGPLVGVLANTEGGVMRYAGLYSRLRIGRLFITPQFAMGTYVHVSRGAVSSHLEFLPGVSAVWRFSGGARFGLRYAWMSRFRGHDRDPGKQELLLVYVWSLPS